MYWLRWHYHVKDIAGAPHRIKRKEKQTERQNRRQSVVAGRQRLYCAVQSRSPNHCQTTTGKVVFSSRRNVVSDGAFLTDDGRLFHARAEATGKARSRIRTDQSYYQKWRCGPLLFSAAKFRPMRCRIKRCQYIVVHPFCDSTTKADWFWIGSA